MIKVFRSCFFIWLLSQFLLGPRKSCFRCANTIRTSADLELKCPQQGLSSCPGRPRITQCLDLCLESKKGIPSRHKGTPGWKQGHRNPGERRGGALVAHGPQTGKLDRLTPRFGGFRGSPTRRPLSGHASGARACSVSTPSAEMGGA